MAEGRSESQVQPRQALEVQEGEVGPKEREIRGTWEAIQYVDRVAKDGRRTIDEQIVRSIHGKVMGHFHPAIAGRYRDYDVRIKRAIFLPPHWSKVKQAMWQFGRELTERTKNLGRSLSSIEDVIKVGAWAHYQLARIHPFADGNGRTARLLTDLIFKRAGLYYITDWGAENDDYVQVLKTADVTNEIGHFEKFLAQKLLARYDGVVNSLAKGPISQVAKKSSVLRDIQNRREELSRIASSESLSAAAVVTNK